MMQTMLIVFGACLFCLSLTRVYLEFARGYNLIDIPNARSSHKTPVPVGGGLPLLAVTLLVWPVIAWPLAPHYIVLIVVMVGLGALSWLDDRLELPWWFRLGVQAGGVGILLSLLPSETRILPLDLPLLGDRIIAGLAWLWFINLFNFMDGIDGLAGGEVLTIALGIAFLSNAAHLSHDSIVLVIVLGGAVMGFLWWNWSPARIFLGDTGSIPLGFVLGYLLIELSSAGYFAASIILPLYFVADASFTLISRIFRGEKAWQAHREHFYQRAVAAGHSHDKVVIRIMVANGLLIGLAILSQSFPWLSVILALAVTAGILFCLERMSENR